MAHKIKTYSRKKIHDRFTDLRKADGKPMSRQQVHMMRKRHKGICLTCTEKTVGDSPYCLNHMVKARENMRSKFGYERRLRDSLSYRLQAKQRARARA